MSDSVLNRLRQNRNRATVAPRSDALVYKSQVSPTVTEEVATAPQAPDPEVQPISTEPETGAGGSTIADLKAELTKFPETHRHSAVVLEKALDQELTHYCKDHRITVEVFLEAAWVYASANPEAMEQILAEAKQRYSSRKQAGKIRRLITMLEG